VGEVRVVFRITGVHLLALSSHTVLRISSVSHSVEMGSRGCKVQKLGGR
jgi:hypothetical protein